jgi:eukaryotic-like serine/threonine-protein kinase
MALDPGSRVDHYEIAEIIGKGGMGEVYRASDTRLPRDVAIKTSQQKFSDRFAREAKVIASLNHPNICTLFDVGPNFLVMEMIEGPTLSERIKAGPVGLDETAHIMRQVADALDYAHEKGVVHRDLKPGNIKIRPDGLVKVLDFGLAKVGPSVAASGDPENSPTITLGETQAGVVLGTAAYMAPEQAMGKPVDKRADVWAFGVVFYEMLTGARMHTGDSVQEVLASVLKDEPDLTKVPPQAHRLIRRCLEKDPNKRLRHVGDVMALLDDAPVSGSQTAIAPLPAEPSKKKWLWLAVAGIAVVAGGVAYWAPWRSPENPSPVRFEVHPTGKVSFLNTGAAVSPDGKWLSFAARGDDGALRYYLRSVDSIEIRALPGTETQNGFPPPPFWSPDSRFIAFPVNANPFAPGQLKKVDISGGPPQTICNTRVVANSGTWNRDGVILFGSSVNSGVRRVAAAGGMSIEVTVLDPARKERAHQFPQFLADGKHFLYQRVSTAAEFTGMYIGSLDSKPEQQSTKPLLVIDRQATYIPASSRGPARLLFQRDATVFVQALDEKRMELLGEAAPVVDQVGALPQAAAGFFWASPTALAYRLGTGAGLSKLTWFDASGKAGENIGDPGVYNNPTLSPDGTRVAASVFDPAALKSNIWVLDLKRGSGTRLTFNSGGDTYPVWSPDSKRIVFGSNKSGPMDLYVKPADGSGDEVLLLKSDQDKRPTSWSKDGRYLIYQTVDPKTREDLWVLPMEGDRKPTPLLTTEFRERNGRFSADGRWIAYQSNESGSDEIYVRPFSPGVLGSPGGKWMVSKGGGFLPRWRADGKELFYSTQTDLWAVDLTAGAVIQPGVPKKLFLEPLSNWFDITPDGNRFLFSAQNTIETQSPVMVVLNWQSTLK